jgi:hypothetical protein
MKILNHSHKTENSEVLERVVKLASRRGFRAGLIGGLVPFLALVFLGATRGNLDALFIDQNGRVGINTNEPKAYLDVNGNAIMDTLEVNSSLNVKTLDVSDKARGDTLEVRKSLNVKGSTNLHDVQIDGQCNINNDLIVNGRKQALGKITKIWSSKSVGKNAGTNYRTILLKQSGESVKSDGFVSVVATISGSNSEVFYLRGWLKIDAGDSIAAGSAACNAVANQDYPIATNSFMMPVRKGQEWWVEYLQSFQAGSTYVDIFWTPLTE